MDGGGFEGGDDDDPPIGCCISLADDDVVCCCLEDFGKGELSLALFDGGNVLPWLSPTSYHLFSPGVMVTTPRGMFSGIPRTPRTTTNQLFFRDPDDQHNNSEVETKKGTGSGLNDVMQICVSPLAPSKRNSTNGIISKNHLVGTCG